MATWTFYSKALQFQHGGTADRRIDYTGDSVCLALVPSTYTPSQDHDFLDDVGAEVGGNNYTKVGAGGNVLASKTLTLATATGIVTFDAADETFTQDAGGFTTARYAILYKNVANGTAGSPVIAYADLAADKGNVSGDLVFQWDAAGIFTVAGA